MSRSSVVPWWGRLLPWLCAVVAAGCLGWSLGIDGWRLSACMVGITLIQVAMAVHVTNSEADRGQR
ncbi:MAG: hypothetical protein WBB52_02175 [Acidimicrobiales bacterium]